ncbi:MAG: trypsin-like peptidase domain-containing protein, partial [Bacteroidota bacterium]
MNIKKIIGVLLAGAFGAGITLGLTGNLLPKEKESIIRVEHRTGLPVTTARYGNDAGLLDFTVAAERAMPAVVHIKSTSTRPSRGGGRSQVPDLFREFFGPDIQAQPNSPRPSVGSGSGVILSEDGYIVTNNHVIDRADDIEVVLNDNRSYKAEV